jgi:hypothetical protein
LSGKRTFIGQPHFFDGLFIIHNSARFPMNLSMGREGLEDSPKSHGFTPRHCRRQ